MGGFLTVGEARYYQDDDGAVYTSEDMKIKVADSFDELMGVPKQQTLQEKTQTQNASDNPDLSCPVDGCDFVAATKNGLTTHRRMKHII
jgi:hypothetical protein